MKYVFIISLLIVGVGCGMEPTPKLPRKYAVGEKVQISVNGKPAIVVGHYGNTGYSEEYGIRYSNDLGSLEYDTVKEYELQKWKER